jgi:HAD superfamily hydrolase (TIGR01484 family)
MKKHYKALMLDLDGTTIPNKVDGFPSARVAKAIHEAMKQIHVATVTSRSMYAAKPVIQHLKFVTPCIVEGGAHIVDPINYKTVWQVTIPNEEIKEIVALLKKRKAPFLYPKPSTSLKPSFRLPVSESGRTNISIPEITHEHAEIIIEELKQFKNIITHKVTGWEEGKVWVTINHAEATKQLSILRLAQMLKIETHEIIGIGDSYNDFPMMMACGLKVAMGNAVPDLKEIADYIAPSVDEDGVADVIEKFILN